MKPQYIAFTMFIAFMGSFSVADAQAYIFSRDLALGQAHVDVRELQKMLNSDPATRVSATGFGSPGNESFYFGVKTQAAVVAFQKKYAISPSVGYIGPITRARLNTLSAFVGRSATTVARANVASVATVSASRGGSQAVVTPSQSSASSESSSGGSSSGSSGGSGGGSSSGTASPAAQNPSPESAPMTAAASAAVSVVQTPVPNAGQVCNTSLLDGNGLSPNKMIDRAACEKLNSLYTEGKAAGNAGDLYDNRDGLHVNFCVGWTPSPDCPPGYRLFPQHEWRISGAGRATSPTSKPTLGQASYSGSVDGSIKHSIPYDMYKSQSGADTLYNLYTGNSLYVYPSLYEDSYTGSIYDTATLANPVDVDSATENMANTPYAIASKQICKCGADSLRVHDASGSDLAFIELGFAGLAALRPEVKSALADKGMLMPTLQALIRYSHKSVGGSDSYVSSPAHRSSYMAHYVTGGEPRSAYNPGKLVDMANSLGLADVPPVVRLEVASETFDGSEKVFSTPGAISRKAARGAGAKEIVVSAAKSAHVLGSGALEYRFAALDGDSSRVEVTVDPNDSSKATIKFMPGDSTQRIDVGVFAKRAGSAYYSTPGIVSLYVQ